MRTHNETTRFGSNPTLPQELANKAYVDSSGGASPLTTKGDIFGFSTVDDRIPIGTNGQRLTADSAEALGLKWETPSGGSGNTFARIIKKADETITSSTTLHDDNELVVALNINKTYHYYLFLPFNTGPVADIKYAFSLPTGATGLKRNGGDWDALAETALSDITNTLSPLVSIANNFAIVTNGLIIMSGTAGNLILQWAQNVSDAADTTVLQGATLVLWEETA